MQHNDVKQNVKDKHITYLKNMHALFFKCYFYTYFLPSHDAENCKWINIQGTFKCINTDRTYRNFSHSNTIDI